MGMLRMPNAIERSVRRQNIQFMHNRNQFCSEYFQFMRRLITCNNPPANLADTLVRTIFWKLFYFITNDYFCCWLTLVMYLQTVCCVLLEPHKTCKLFDLIVVVLSLRQQSGTNQCLELKLWRKGRGPKTTTIYNNSKLAVLKFNLNVKRVFSCCFLFLVKWIRRVVPAKCAAGCTLPLPHWIAYKEDSERPCCRLVWGHLVPFT
jgi:hypothetical protein